MHGGGGSARIARVSQRCLHENCPQMLEKEQWTPNNFPNLNGMEIVSEERRTKLF